MSWGKWVNETSAPLLKTMLLEPIPALGFLLGPCDYSASARLCLCACLSQSSCVCAYSFVRMCSTKFWCVCVVTRMTHWELKARLSAGSEFLKQVPAHLVVIGRRKKGPCVLGTGSKTLTQPCITQPCTVQNQPKPGGKIPTAALLPFNPPCLF